LDCEWAKCQPQSDWWLEEIQLLIKEMCWVICYLDWKANWWWLHVTSHYTPDTELAEGLKESACKQEHI
jgi:hypothetical protein